jgi:hypothetical protein
MRVKVKKDTFDFFNSEGYDFVSSEFEVESQDDGEYSLCPFYAGWMEDNTGRKMWMSWDQDDCEVINWD